MRKKQNKREYFSKILAVLGGCFISIALIFSYLSLVPMRSDYHKKLLVKYDIPNNAYKVISSSYHSYTSSLKESSLQKYTQNEETLSLIEKSITREMVSKNLNNVSDGLFAYLNSEKKSLPDIHLTYQNQENTSSALFTEFIKFDKINLSAVLLYLDRTDIIDSMQFIKLMFYFFILIPKYSFIIAAIFIFIAMLLSAKNGGLRKLFILISSSALSIYGVIATLVMIYNLFYMKSTIYPITMSLPLENGVIEKYIFDILSSFFEYLVVLCFLNVLFIVLLLFFPRRILFDKPYDYVMSQYKKVVFLFFTFLGRKGVSFILLLLVGVIISGLFSTINQDVSFFYRNDFDYILLKLNSSSSTQKVVLAKDNFIYTLVITILDRESKKPMSNIDLSISGKEDDTSKYFSKNLTTDSSGVTRIDVDKGNYRLNFSSENFPIEYVPPSTSFHDIKKPGVTFITISLDKKPEKIKGISGFAEIELIDNENNPIENISLEIIGNLSAEGDPDFVTSISNKAGIAIFKLFEGRYTAKCSSEIENMGYQAFSPFEFEVKSDITQRYTLQLLKK